MEFIIGALSSVAVAMLSYTMQQLIKDNRKLTQEKKQKETEKDEGIRDGVVCLLRIQLIEYHAKYMELGKIPNYVYESFKSMYKAYHALGGNGLVTRMMEDIEELEITNRRGEE